MKSSKNDNGRRGKERRKNPDRRNGFYRRKNDSQALVENDVILNTKEACCYLKISRPTFLNEIKKGTIKAKKIGNAWKVFKTDLDRLVRE